jgi:hypothetical protein
MKSINSRKSGAGILLAASLLPFSVAHAQLGDVLKQGAGAAGNAAGGIVGPSMGGMSMGNIAGILQYCVKNSFIGATQAGQITDKLIGKLGGPQAAASDKGYQLGEKGVVQTGDGKEVDIGGGSSTGSSSPGSAGTKGELAKSVCTTALNQAKKFL